MMSVVQREITENRLARLQPLLNELPVDAFDPELPSLVSVTCGCVEKHMMQTLRPATLAALSCGAQQAEAAASVRQHLVHLKAKPQSYFQIDAKIQSPSDWNSCVAALNKLGECKLPTPMLRALVATGKAVFELFEAEHPAATPAEGQKKKSPLVLAGDDLLPVVIFLVCRCTVPELARACQYMWQLSDPGLQTGECGYYLTVFESAVHWIQMWSPSGESPFMQPAESPPAPPSLMIGGATEPSAELNLAEPEPTAAGGHDDDDFI